MKHRATCRALAAALSLGASTSAFSQNAPVPAFYRADRLFETCQQDNAACTAYIMAVTDTAAAAGVPGICIPSGISARQPILAFQNYARQRPASLSGPAAQIVLLALAETFPCLPN